MYWTGISQPAKSISRAPSAACRRRGRLVDGRLDGRRSRRGLGSRSSRGGLGAAATPSTSAARATSARSVSNVSIGRRLVEVDPADLVELVVVAGEVAAGRLHEEVVDGLVDARARTGRTSTRWTRAAPVIRTSRPVSSATSRRAVSSVVSPRSGVPLGSVQVRPSRSRRRLPTTSWGRPASYRTTMPPAEVAVAVLRRATAPGGAGTATRPGAPGAGPVHRDQRARIGRSRTRGRAGRWAAPAGAQAGDGPASEPRSTVGARPTAREGRGRRAGPSRRSRARLDGRTNRAAGRAAYLAAMLCSMGRNGSASVGRLQAPSSRAVAHGLAVSGASAPRASARSISRRGGGDVERRATPGAWARERGEVRLERADVAAGHRAGQRGPDAERPGVAQRLLDERAVDRQRRRPRRARRPRPSSAIASSRATNPPAARTAAAW